MKVIRVVYREYHQILESSPIQKRMKNLFYGQHPLIKLMDFRKQKFIINETNRCNYHLKFRMKM